MILVLFLVPAETPRSSHLLVEQFSGDTKILGNFADAVSALGQLFYRLVLKLGTVL